MRYERRNVFQMCHISVHRVSMCVTASLHDSLIMLLISSTYAQMTTNDHKWQHVVCKVQLLLVHNAYLVSANAFHEIKVRHCRIFMQDVITFGLRRFKNWWREVAWSITLSLNTTFRILTLQLRHHPKMFNVVGVINTVIVNNPAVEQL